MVFRVSCLMFCVWFRVLSIYCVASVGFNVQGRGPGEKEECERRCGVSRTPNPKSQPPSLSPNPDAPPRPGRLALSWRIAPCCRAKYFLIYEEQVLEPSYVVADFARDSEGVSEPHGRQARANMAHIGQCRPDYGLGFQVKAFELFPLRSEVGVHPEPGTLHPAP